jgi:hypothetical protein
MSTRSAIALALLCTAPLAALAETAAAPPGPQATENASPAPAGKGKRWQACAVELEKFCSTVEKGKGLKRACLESHSAELSDGCKTSMAEHAERAKERDAQ